MNVKSWLRRKPEPVIVVVDGAKRITIGAGPRRWSDAAETIDAMGATRLEALDLAGAVLRATTLEEDEEPAPDGKVSGQTDLAQFAGLLSKAYDQGANATRASYELAFTENTKLVGLLASRLGALEVAWQRSMQASANLQAQLAQASADGGDGAEVLSILGGMMGGGGKVNGSKASKGKE